MTEEMKSVTRRIEDLWNTGNLAVADEIYSPALVNHAPYAPDFKDFQSCKQCVSAVRAGMPDFTVKIEDAIAEGDKLVCRWVARGSHTGDFFGIPPSNNKVEWTGMTLYRMDSGKIVEAWWNEDMLGLMKQIGVIPAG
jgi:predicted ester cyclase